MTLGTTHTQESYLGDGSTIEFDVNFEFHANTDIEVIVVTAATGFEALQSEGVDYSVTGGDGSTGQVIMTTAPAATERLVIRRVSSDLQPDDLVDGGALPAEPLERRLDILTARLQELQSDIARAVKVAKGSEATGLELNLIGGANKGLSVAADENGVIVETGVIPGEVVTSPFGKTWVGLAGKPEARNDLELGSAATLDSGTSGAVVPLLDGNNTYSGTATFSADATFNSDLIVGAPFVLGSETLTINSSGEIAPTKSSVLVNNDGAAATDDLDTIAVANHPTGAIIELRAGTAGQVPTLKHAFGGGNIFLAEDIDVALDDRDKTIWLQRRSAGEHGAGWYEIGRNFVFKSSLEIDVIDDTTITSAVGSYSTSWDNVKDYKKVEVLCHGLAPSVNSIPELFVSSNGGTSFYSGPSDYAWINCGYRTGVGAWVVRRRQRHPS